jgi:hypothetical protein
MKLIGNLKKEVENAKTKEEARESIKKAGMLLDDDELEQVSGGITPSELHLLNMKFAQKMKETTLSSIKNIEEQIPYGYELQEMAKKLEENKAGIPYEGPGTPTVPSGGQR